MPLYAAMYKRAKTWLCGEFFPSTAEVNAIWVHEVISGHLNLPQRPQFSKADPSKNYSGLLSEVLAFH